MAVDVLSADLGSHRLVGRQTGNRSVLVSLLTVRGLATVLFRLSQVVGARSSTVAGLIKQLNHVLTGADLAWQADVGPGFVLFHPTGVVVGPYVRIGSDCRVQQGVSLGGGADASPRLGDGVSLGAGSKIFGNIDIGSNVQVGSNAVVLIDVPGGATAVGVPARVVAKP